METKKQNNSNLKKTVNPIIMVCDARGFLYRKEDQSSTILSPEERESLLASWK